MSDKIIVTINEHPHDVAAGTSLFSLRSAVKPDGDIMILNGAPAIQDCMLQDKDTVVFIRRGEMPSPDELEGLMAARHTPGIHQKLKSASVGIAGLGGLGSNIALALARIGVGRLVLADFDVVEPSNLNRQQYFVDQIGMMKTEALAATLKRANPYISVATHAVRLTPENIPDVFSTVDVLAEAFDRAEEKAMLIETAIKHLPHTPVVAASGLAGYDSANRITTQKVRRNLYVCGDGESAARPGHGLMAPRVGVVAHHQANAIMRLILGENAL